MSHWTDRQAGWLKALLSEHAAEADAPAPPEESDEPTMPVLTPDTWRRVDCHCGSCEVCRYFMSIDMDEAARPWGDKPRARVVYDRPRWPSPQAALEAYVTHMQDGYSARSIGGVVVDAGVEGQLSGSGTYGPPSAMRAAEDMASLKPVIDSLFARGERNVSPAECVQILIARVVGRVTVIDGKDRRRHRIAEKVPAAELAEHYAIRKGEVAGIVRAGRHRLSAELAARGLVPMPRRDSRAYPAAQRRREELLARRVA